MQKKGGGGVAEKSWPSKKDASLSARTPSKSFKHTFDNLDFSLIYKNQALLNPYYITN